MTGAARRLVTLLSVLTVFAPISTDIHLPVLPELTGDPPTGAAA